MVKDIVSYGIGLQVLYTYIFIPGLEGVISHDALLLLRDVLPLFGISQVYQSFSIEQAESKATVHHETGAIPLPARVIR